MEIKKRTIVAFIVAAVVWISIAILVHISFFTQVKIPYGVWHSDTPDITIDIDPSNTKNNRYYGEYVEDGEIIPITFLFVRETYKFDEFAIYDISSGEGDMINGSAYFAGSWKYSKIYKKLYFKLYPKLQESTGYKAIVFEKIHSYD